MTSTWTDPFSRLFHRSAAIILGVTGLLKAVGAFAGHPLLNGPDPLFDWLTRRQLAGGAAGFELLLAVAIWNSRCLERSWFLVAWITSVFLAYRTGLWLIGYQGICPCLGASLDAWTGSALAEDRVATALFLYLLTGTLMTSFLLWRRRFGVPTETACA